MVGGVLSMSTCSYVIEAMLATLSAQLPVADWSLPSLLSVTGALIVDAFTPEPPSVHAKLICTLWLVQVLEPYAWLPVVVIAPAVIVGAFLSTLMPPIGPAVAQLLIASQTWSEPVEAFAVSLPDGTLVERVKLASDALARPDPESAAVHASETSVACQSPSGCAHWRVGAVVSTSQE